MQNIPFLSFFAYFIPHFPRWRAQRAVRGAKARQGVGQRQHEYAGTQENKCSWCSRLGSEFSQEFDRSQGPEVELGDPGKVPDVLGNDGSTPGGNRQFEEQIVFRVSEKWTPKKVHLLAPGHRAEVVDDRIRCF